MINKYIETVNNNSRIFRRVASKKYFDDEWPNYTNKYNQKYSNYNYAE